MYCINVYYYRLGSISIIKPATNHKFSEFVYAQWPLEETNDL